MNDEWGAGDRAEWKNHGLVTVGDKRYPLICGQHPHSRTDNCHYVELDPGAEPVGFSGHRILIDVQIEMGNYLKSSHITGDDVRAGGSCTILADGEPVFEFFTRDTLGALLRAHQVITKLSEHSSGWLVKEERDRLVGRKVFYREIPAVVERLIVDQGCVILATADGQPFPLPVWSETDDPGEREPSVKVEVTDPNVWWFRKDE